MKKLRLLMAVAAFWVFPFEMGRETRRLTQDNTARAIRIKISQGSQMPLGRRDMDLGQTSKDSHDRHDTERTSTA